MDNNLRFTQRLAALFRRGETTVSVQPLSGKTSVTAHSGCMGLADNSLEAMAAGIAAGAAIVEFDLNYTADGTPVLSHNAPKKAACVTLAEAFAFLAGQDGIQANVDVKSTEHLEKVPALAAEAGVTERIFFTGVDDKMVPAVKEKCPGIPYYLNAVVRKKDDADALAKKTAALGAVGINLNWKGASPQLIRAFHKKGLPVSVWTVNKPRRIVQMARLGVDNITSRRPELVCDLLQKTGAEENTGK